MPVTKYFNPDVVREMVNVTLQRSIPLAILLTSVVGVTTGWATPVTNIGDTVWIDPFRTGCSGANCDSSSYPDYRDHLGANYDTTSIVVTKNVDKTMTISLTTTKAAFPKVAGTSGASQPRYDGSIPYADLAIAIRDDAYVSDPANVSSQDFDLAIELNRSTNGVSQDYTGPWYAKNYYNYGAGTANIYEADSANDMWISSQEAYNGLGGSGSFGGRFRDAACGGSDLACIGDDHDVFVNVDDAEKNDLTNAAGIKYTDGASTTVIEITLTFAALQEMGLVSADGYYSDFELFWGTAWCGNDAIWGVVVGDEPPPSNDVPEPASLALFGVGLAGLALARRRKAA